MPKKFKAWDTKEKKWIEDFLITPFGKVVVSVSFETFNKPEAFITNENAILIRFTGLFDKNGTPIYEGDVVLWKQAEGGLLQPNETTHTCQIKWIRSSWNCEDVKPLKDDYHSCFTFSSCHIKLLGSSLDHPELIK